MDNAKSLKYVIPIAIAFVLIVFGAYQLFKSKLTKPVVEVSPVVISSPNGFQLLQSPSPTPDVLSGTTPNIQPAAGSDTVEIKNVGIYVDAPVADQKIISPLKVSGRANVFDGNVQIRVKDANGTILGSSSAIACLGIDACPFETSVAFTKPNTTAGSLELYSPNATDGAEDYLQIIAIQF
ncbi:MAG: Gmad2 immunoglobulin-like domain-containing protein [Candidatus Curtissbacteria bacterium]|nr:Gmad2 immunoglobulin-like domain-containing protein [Candidatus Curtissbacteria bacterium]